MPEARLAAMGSTDEEDGPLINVTETVPPAGSVRAYLARRRSIPGRVVAVGVPFVVVGGGRFREVVGGLSVLGMMKSNRWMALNFGL